MKKINHIGRIISIILIGNIGVSLEVLFKLDSSSSETLIIISIAIASIIAIIYIRDVYLQIIRPIVNEKFKDMKKHQIEEELLRAKELLDNGILTQEEFDQKVKQHKNDIL